MSFKKGQRVVCANPSTPFNTKGTRGVVTHVDKDVDFPISVAWDGGASDGAGVMAAGELELEDKGYRVDAGPRTL